LDKAKPGLPFKGWAHEARVYAEDPTRGFLPSIGRLTTYIEPKSGPSEGVRCDTGVVQGSEISMYYDPMICKLCTYAPTRQEALDKLEVALDNYMIQGVGHNIPFLRDVIRDQRFKDGRLTTNYIPEQYPEGFVRVNLTPDERIRLAAITAQMDMARQEKIVSIGDGSEEIETELYVLIEKQPYRVVVDAETGATSVFVPDSDKPVSVELQSFDWPVDSSVARVQIDNKLIPVQYHSRLPSGYRLQMCGSTLDITVRNAREQALAKFMVEKKKADTSKFLMSPMPGVLVSVSVKPGDQVFAGQDLCIVEAMKMQNNLQAPKNSVVKTVFAKPGQSLAVDENIIEFE
jgi:propionyl-CoA carboxylase alpha chain